MKPWPLWKQVPAALALWAFALVIIAYALAATAYRAVFARCRS